MDRDEIISRRAVFQFFFSSSFLNAGKLPVNSLPFPLRTRQFSFFNEIIIIICVPKFKISYSFFLRTRSLNKFHFVVKFLTEYLFF